MAILAKYGDPYSESVLCNYPIQVHTRTAVSSEQTHKQREHTPGSSGQPFYAAAPGDQLGDRCLAQGSHLSRGNEGGESAGHSLPPPTFPARPETQTSDLLGYKSDSLSIRPWLSQKLTSSTI